MKLNKIVGLLLAGLMTVGLASGCRAPDYREVQTNETPFLIPLEGDTTKQGGIEGVEFYKKNLVFSKRIQIPYTYKDRRNGWLPSHRLIIVKRSPVTREWTSDNNTGTTSKTEGIGAQSKESVPLEANFACVAQIIEKDAPLYLYYYGVEPPTKENRDDVLKYAKSLETVMDTEVRNMLQKYFTIACARYYVKDNELVSNTAKIQLYVEQNLTDYFKKKGISITSIGLIGKITFGEEIQKAINTTITTEQNLIAQRKRNTQTIETAQANAKAAQAIAKAQGGINYQLRMRELDNQAALIASGQGLLSPLSGSNGKSGGATVVVSAPPISPVIRSQAPQPASAPVVVQEAPAEVPPTE